MSPLEALMATVTKVNALVADDDQIRLTPDGPAITVRIRNTAYVMFPTDALRFLDGVLQGVKLARREEPVEDADAAPITHGQVMRLCESLDKCATYHRRRYDTAVRGSAEESSEELKASLLELINAQFRAFLGARS